MERGGVLFCTPPRMCFMILKHPRAVIYSHVSLTVFVFCCSPIQQMRISFYSVLTFVIPLLNLVVNIMDRLEIKNIRVLIYISVSAF